jgi:hypothetical protein
LIGYGQNQYRIWDITLKRAIWSRDIKILENYFINSNNNNTIQNTTNELEINLSSNTNNNTNNNNNNNTSFDSSTTSNTIEETNNNLDQIDLINPDYSNNITTDTSDTETLNNDIDNSLDELALVLLNNTNNEPKTYKQALESLNKQDWINAMNTEIKELENQNTWNLTNLPPNKNLLRGKWVYKIKKDNKGLIIKYKAR